MCDDLFTDDGEDGGILDYFDDTAECPACGAYYCTCCGCNCLDLYYEMEDEE